MASFSPEEIDFILKRGNEYCRRIWLGLYDASRGRDAHDEQGIKNFMIAKYERKRYYLDPSMANFNGTSTISSSTPNNEAPHLSSTHSNHVNAPTTARPVTGLAQSFTMPALSTVAQQNCQQNAVSGNSSSTGFLADFSSVESLSAVSQPDPFAAVAAPPAPPPTSSTISNFANFDNNPVFESTNGLPSGFSLPSSASFPVTRRSAGAGAGAGAAAGAGGSVFQPPPSEDRYAALKDLDCLMKSQSEQSEWSHGGSGAVSSAAPAAAPVVVPAAPVSSQGAAWAAFGPTHPATPFGDSTANMTMTSNPFIGATTCGSPWGAAVEAPVGANPFKTARTVQDSNPVFPWGTASTSNNGAIANGFHSSQSFTFPSKTWATETEGNPFTLGASAGTTGHSSNPFL